MLAGGMSYCKLNTSINANKQGIKMINEIYFIHALQNKSYND